MMNCKNQTNTNREPCPLRLGRRGKRAFGLCALLLGCFACLPITAYATGDPVGAVNNFSDFIFGLIRAVGIIILGWGVVQVGLSIQSHDPSQRSNGILTLLGGVVITFTKEILALITGG